MIYAGIDEAGYGPLLGPLCVGSSAFRLEGGPAAVGERGTGNAAAAPGTAGRGQPPCDLWERLAFAVCRRPRDPRRRIAIADSKRLKSSGKRPLIHLERGVLAFLDRRPSDDAELFEALGCAPRVSAATPWHTARLAVPVHLDEPGVAIARNLVARAGDEGGVSVGHLGVDMLDAPAFNAIYRSLGNKSALNMSLVFDALRRIDLARGREKAFVAIDRQGGRASYGEDLAANLGAGRRIEVLVEDQSRSTYAVGQDLVVSFEVEAEERHLPVALASMAAKYAREVSMRRLNEFFTSRRPEIAPTAGYVEDGRRFLAEVKPVLLSEGIPAEDFVRIA